MASINDEGMFRANLHDECKTFIEDTLKAAANEEWAVCADAWERRLLQSPDDENRSLWLEKRAQALEASGRFDEAGNCYLELIIKCPTHPNASAAMARLAGLREDSLAQWLDSRGHDAFNAGEYDKSGKFFEALVAKFPLFAGGYSGLALLAVRRWKWSEALDLWGRSSKLSPPNLQPDITRRKAECLVKIGRINDAVELLSTIRDRLPGIEGLAEIAVSQQPHHIAGQLWDECTAKFPADPQGPLGKSQLLLSRQAYAEAEPLFKYMVELWPQCVAAAVLWARCATEAKNWHEAASRWQYVLDCHELNSDIIGGYARYLAAINDRVAAHVFLDRLGDARAIAGFQLEYHLAADDYDATLSHSLHLIQLEPDNLWTRLRHVYFLMRHGSMQSVHAALWFLRDLHGRSPDMTAVICPLAETLIRAGFEEQAGDLIESISAEEKQIDIEILRAWSLHHRGNDTAAKQSWQGILERRYFAEVHAPIQDLTRFGGKLVRTKPGEIVVFSVMRNEGTRLDWFLDYYRRLGVDKFVIADNGSNDQSVELLQDKPDVILYRTKDSYAASGFGMRWINELIEQHGANNWCLHVDADEAFVFPNCQSIGLRGLTEDLDRQGHECMLAPLIDLYPSRVPYDSTASDIRDIQSSYLFFDNQFEAFDIPICPYKEIYGGVRRRLMHGYQLLNKVPLINGAAGIRFLLSSHQTTPAQLADMRGALLHYHLVNLFEPQYKTLLTEAIERREFPSNSLERWRSREILRRLSPYESLLYERSVKFDTATNLGPLWAAMA
jgi:tetratricopeptide (TPR) repeat protein